MASVCSAAAVCDLKTNVLTHLKFQQQDKVRVKHVTCAASLLTPSARSRAALLMHAPLTLLRALRWLAAQPCGRGALADGACCTVLCLGTGIPVAFLRH